MKTLIIASGHCGTTLKAAEKLKDKIGNADIFDTNDKNVKTDFSSYDNFVFGSNIRMFMLNFRFSKWAKKLKKYYKTKNVYGYLIGAMENNETALKKFSKKLQNNKGTVFAWGEFAVHMSKGQTQKMYADMKVDCEKKGKELPHIKEEELDRLANLIKKGN